MRPTLAAAFCLAVAGCLQPVSEQPPGPGDAGSCGGLYCPTGCDISADCASCNPQSATAGLGSACQSDLDCCTGKCRSWASVGQGGGVCTAATMGCSAEGNRCAQGPDCCSGLCGPDGICTSGHDAGTGHGAVGTKCQQASDCGSQYCKQGLCACNVSGRGYACASDADCCDGVCAGGVCAGYRGVPDSGSTCGSLGCPTGCYVSADCLHCVPEGPGAGLGSACQSDLDCCNGSCLDGACEGAGGGVDSGPGGCTPAGSDPFVGNWSGMASITESLGGNMGGGGGGPDSEAATAGGPGSFQFQNFLSDTPGTDFLQPGCTLTFAEQGNQNAAATGVTDCADTGNVTWQFTKASATLDPGACTLTVEAGASVLNPNQNETVAVTLTLHRQ